MKIVFNLPLFIVIIPYLVNWISLREDTQQISGFLVVGPLYKEEGVKLIWRKKVKCQKLLNHITLGRTFSRLSNHCRLHKREN